MWNTISELFPLLFLVGIALYLYDGFRRIRTEEFTRQEGLILTRQLIATILFFLLFWVGLVTEIGFSPAVLWFLSVPLLYTGISILKNGISYIAFRGNLGPIRDTEAIAMGVLVISMALGFVLYGFFS